MSFIMEAGPFGLVVLATGALGVVIAGAQLVTRRDLQGAVTWCAAAAVLWGMIGTGLGLSVASHAVSQVDDPAMAAKMWRQATAIAESTTTLGAMAALLDLVALAGVTLLRPPRRD